MVHTVDPQPGRASSLVDRRPSTPCGGACGRRPCARARAFLGSAAQSASAAPAASSLGKGGWRRTAGAVARARPARDACATWPPRTPAPVAAAGAARRCPAG